MSDINNHSIDEEIFLDEPPIFLPNKGTYQFADGKEIYCKILWDKNHFQNKLDFIDIDDEELLWAMMHKKT